MLKFLDEQRGAKSSVRVGNATPVSHLAPCLITDQFVSFYVLLSYLFDMTGNDAKIRHFQILKL